MRVIFTTHAHRRDGLRYGGVWRIEAAHRAAHGLVDGEKGVEMYDELKPLPDEIAIKKHRYSARLAIVVALLFVLATVEAGAVRSKRDS